MLGGQLAHQRRDVRSLRLPGKGRRLGRRYGRRLGGWRRGGRRGRRCLGRLCGRDGLRGWRQARRSLRPRSGLLGRGSLRLSRNGGPAEAGRRGRGGFGGGGRRGVPGLRWFLVWRGVFRGSGRGRHRVPGRRLAGRRVLGRTRRCVPRRGRRWPARRVWVARLRAGPGLRRLPRLRAGRRFAGRGSPGGLGWRGCGRLPVGRLVDDRELGANGHRFVLGHGNPAKNPGRWGRYLGVDLIRGDFEQRLVSLHALAFLLQPARDGALGDALAELGHGYRDRHCSS